MVFLASIVWMRPFISARSCGGALLTTGTWGASLIAAAPALAVKKSRRDRFCSLILNVLTSRAGDSTMCANPTKESIDA